jgi:hypothetical protein
MMYHTTHLEPVADKRIFFPAQFLALDLTTFRLSSDSLHLFRDSSSRSAAPHRSRGSGKGRAHVALGKGMRSSVSRGWRRTAAAITEFRLGMGILGWLCHSGGAFAIKLFLHHSSRHAISACAALTRAFHALVIPVLCSEHIRGACRLSRLARGRHWHNSRQRDSDGTLSV